jgi:CheY-like chemotaxis protein
MNILLVEDQSGPLKVLQCVIDKIFPKYFPEFRVMVVRSYHEAEDLIGKELLDVVFLDHRLSYENQGNLEDTNFDKFCDSLENIGYRLITRIKERNPKSIIIGTSSMKKEALRYGTPDFSIGKIIIDETEECLEKILREVKQKKEEV